SKTHVSESTADSLTSSISYTSASISFSPTATLSYLHLKLSGELEDARDRVGCDGHESGIDHTEEEFLKNYILKLEFFLTSSCVIIEE
ncbi:hypothetical protein PMAYCL1PPCAC_25997, partial [Pristionchus mayeri]